VAFIYLRVLLHDKFETVDEVQEAITVPCLGSIPMHETKADRRLIVVEKNKNDIMAEAFRTLRTSLQFVMKKNQGKVVMFTSTVSGEGKTFIAANLAVSTVLLGKKVLLVGCDIRRPRLAEMFDFSANSEGLTSYLAAYEDDVKMLDRLIIPSNVVDGLDLLPAGIVPPNPAELLSSSNLDKAVDYLRGKYDYIVFDAAPVGLVADSLIISRVVDVSLYVMRYDYTQKADLKYLNEVVSSGKLENVSLVLNGEDFNKKMYGYVRSGRGSNKYSGYGYVK
jgi:capsular exopolysaccharide synthesis family protein